MIAAGTVGATVVGAIAAQKAAAAVKEVARIAQQAAGLVKIETNRRIESDLRIETDLRTETDRHIESDRRIESDLRTETDRHIESDLRTETDRRSDGLAERAAQVVVTTYAMDLGANLAAEMRCYFVTVQNQGPSVASTVEVRLTGTADATDHGGVKLGHHGEILDALVLRSLPPAGHAEALVHPADGSLLGSSVVASVEVEWSDGNGTHAGSYPWTD
jgi:hypothetical protein